MLLAFARLCQAQVSVEVYLEQKQYLPNENIPARVRVVNHSGQVLHFGSEDWLSYQVESKEGTVVVKQCDVAIPHNFDINPGDMATTHADLMPCFDTSKAGRYSATASVLIKEWNRSISSKPENFSVVHGAEIWTQEFGLPRTPGDHSEPETRKYIIEEALLLKRKNLYVRVTDAAESKTFKVNCLGATISFSSPKPRLDAHSNLHLIYQESSRRYCYIALNPDGQIYLRQTYAYATSAPFFQTDAAGEPHVIGGARLLASNDLPAVPADFSTNVAPALPPK